MSSDHGHGHEHADGDEARDPAAGSPTIVIIVGSIITVLICFSLIAVEGSLREDMQREVDATAAAPLGATVRLATEARLQAGVHAFPDKDDPNHALDKKHHLGIDQAMQQVVLKYGKR